LSHPAGAAAARAVCVVRAAHGTGEGFAFLEPHWIVTARHVVRDQGLGDAVALVFGGGLDSSAQVAMVHPHVDLAVLRMTGDARGVVPLRPPARHSAVAQPAFCLAFEAGAPSDEAARDPARLLAVLGFERTRRHRDGREEDLFLFPAPVEGSPRSGGPLLSSDGTVVGVIVDSIELAGRTYIRATAIGSVLPMLESTAADSTR
jgi:S1-C subfamily serine protease